MKAGTIAADSCNHDPKWLIALETPEECATLAYALYVLCEAFEPGEDGDGCLAGEMFGNLIDLGVRVGESSAPVGRPALKGTGMAVTKAEGDGNYWVKAPGHISGKILVKLSVSCGKVKRGVGFNFISMGREDLGYIGGAIALEDLEEVVRLARERFPKPSP